MDQASRSHFPTRVLLVCLALVVARTFALPYVTGYGTQLFQVVALGAWSIIAKAISGTFANQHDLVVWSLSGALNIVGFSVPSLPTYILFHSRAPIHTSVVLIAWLIFYLGCLFILFPATDGP
jgi:hypothetical protein